MKKITYILLVLVWGFSSCEGYLEVEPKNLTVVKTYDDVKTLMGACLSEYTQGSSVSNVSPFYSDERFFKTFIYYSGQLDDEVYLDNWWGRNNRGIFYESLQWYNKNFHSNLWNNLYSSIGYYNTVLGELDALGGITEDEANIIQAEAKFLRAWNLLKLIQYFSPYDRDDLGIPVNLNADDVLSYDSERKTQTEVYAIIIKELEDILSYKTEPTEFSLFYDARLVNALLAKVYHFKGASGAGVEGDYDMAIEYATKAMEGKKLASIDEFDDMFDIQESGIEKENPTALLVCTPFGYTNEYRDAVCGIALYNMPNYASERISNLMSDNDIRNAWVNNVDKSISKFKHFYSYGINPYFFFRIADLHLIIAESYARKGDMAEAKTYLEEFQSNRITDYTEFTGSDVLQEILDERKREFCFEFDMLWLDMVRTRKGFTRSAIDNEDVESYTLEDGDYRLTQPIPFNSELENNNIEQNPGWNLH
ncbi:RagB/SusD family nutrient uptake outer membrane protein [Marinifilum sp. D714]|uniref:RagB/SusD family nutrient uptake outer membrane protein n=1 Tax=Marinifilum sp. D714 TaxID=2937523 RepID=UPI0027BF8C71|nr:RagB/SusD family nutrient uptake outer membrane protein [Marinifilum sp. D714]MDQ2178455.1 RagB/SusD family nutrient uptake outer membrane protein [Marinifilum sp. D714]